MLLLHTARTLGAFALVLGVLVFIHEMGHYLAARWRGVHAEVFSIGFGRALAQWTDRRGTVWKLGLIPLGGYVKMHGMAGPGEGPETDPAYLRPGQALFEKSVGSRAIVVAAGPIANFVLAIVLFAGLFMTIGQTVLLPVVGEVSPGGAAAAAGLKPGDRITAIDGTPTATFEALRDIVTQSAGHTINLAVLRDGHITNTPVAIPGVNEGGKHIGRLGVASGASETHRLNPVAAIGAACVESWNVAAQIVTGLAHILTTGQGAGELGGPIKIAQLSGQVAQLGIASLLNFIALLSVNLGLVNLIPIPILDGGHLLFYAAEALRGRPIPARAREYGYRVGLALIACLFVFVSINDLAHAGAFRWVARLIG